MSAATTVRIERRGGFAGLSAQAELEVAALTAAQRRALDAALAAPAASVPSGPDRFSYRIHTVAADGSRTQHDVSEDAMPAVLAALVKPQLP
jgi:hypothetical protein